MADKDTKPSPFDTGTQAPLAPAASTAAATASKGAGHDSLEASDDGEGTRTEESDEDAEARKALGTTVTVDKGKQSEKLYHVVHVEPGGNVELSEQPNSTPRFKGQLTKPGEAKLTSKDPL